MLSADSKPAENRGRLVERGAAATAFEPPAGVSWHTWRIVRAAWVHLLLSRLTRRRTHARAERLHAFLEELGGAWIKLGQALALRFDLLPADYCLQLFRLLNRVRPIAASSVRQVIESELGGPVEHLFRSFEWEPLAAASIGQVHRAELPDGATVAIKIQRPGIREEVRADIRLMRWIAILLDAIPFSRAHAREFVREFARWTEEELDYRIEAGHVAVLRQNAADDPLEHNPRIYPAYTTSRVLTLEYLPGIPVIDIITALRRQDRPFLADLAARGHDTRRIASHIVWNALNQIYRFGYFHADPHPANLIVLADDAIGYVDFGIVGKLDEEMTGALRYFAQSLFAGHIGRAVDQFVCLLTPSRTTDLAAARNDLIDALKGYVESERVQPGGFTASETIFEIEMLAIVRKHAMRLEPGAVRYLKAVLTAEAMVRELDPQFDLRAHENRFFGRLMQIEIGEAFNPRWAAQWFLDARFQLSRVLQSIESVRDTPAHLVGIAQTVRRRVQMLALFTIAGWLTVLAAIADLPAQLGLPRFDEAFRAIGVVVGIASVVSLVLALIQVRRLPSASQPIGRYPRR